MNLLERIASREARVGVIGLGYVGITIATALATAGFRVVGVDVDAERVERIALGQYPHAGAEPELPELLSRVTHEKRLAVTTHYSVLAEVDIVLVAVDTPVGSDHRPRFEALCAACHALGEVMKPNVLVVIESTVAPGTCEKVVAPVLEQASGCAMNEGFLLGHSPERITPGKLLANLRALSRVCGGSNARASELMTALYRTVVTGQLDATDLTTAELVKTAENAYRDVNIAFANELALLCEGAGVDFRRVRELINQCPFRDVHVAGPGVGGQCIPKDPWLLVHGAAPGFEPKVISAARARNDTMPLHVAHLVEAALAEVGKIVSGATVAILGYAYLENSGDTRNSPSEALAEHLRYRGAELRIHDPWVELHAGDLWARVAGADVAVIMVAHDAYRDLDLARLATTLRTPVLVDGRHVVEAADALKHGFVFRGLGRGSPDRRSD